MKQLLTILCFLCLQAAAQKETIGTYYLTKAKVKDGPYKANAFSQFTNGAGTKKGNYFVAKTDGDYVAKTKYQSKDGEVTTYFENGWVQFGIQQDSSFYIYYNKGEDIITCGVLSNTNFYTDNYWDYIVKGYAHEVYRETGINAKIGKATSLTFGKSGVDVYVKSGTKDIIRIKQFYYFTPGAIGFKSTRWDRQPGITGFTVKHLARVKTAGTDNSEIVLSDFGYKKIHTSGAFKEAGSNQLYVTDATGLEVGDNIMVALKKPNRLQVGPGETWPGNGLLFYQLQQPTTLPDGTRAYDIQTMATYQAWGGKWYYKPTFAPVAGGQIGESYYYEDWALGMAYRGTIVKKSGNLLTMGVACTNAFPDGDVWFDPYKILNSLTAWEMAMPVVRTIILPDTLVSSERWHWTGRKGWSIKGNKSVLFTPYGVPEFFFDFHSSCTDMHLSGMVFKAQQGMDSYTYRVWDRAFDGGGAQYLGGLSNGGFTLHDRSTADDISFIDIKSSAIYFGSHCTANNISVVNHSGIGHYMAWPFTFGGDSSVMTNFSADCAEQVPMIESFGGHGNRVSIIKGKNITFSSNGGQGFIVENFDLTYTRNSESFWQARSNPIFNLNNNNQSGSGYAGFIRHGRIHYEGYTDTLMKHLNTGIIIQSSVADAVVDDVVFTLDPSIRNLPTTNLHAVSAEGQNATLTGIVVDGHSISRENGSWNESDYNISCRSGLVDKCIAGSLLVVKAVKLGDNKIQQLMTRPDY